MFFHIAPKDAIQIDPQERMMLKVIWEVLEDGGYTRESLNQNGTTGLYIGSMYDHYPQKTSNGQIQYLGSRRWEMVNRCSYFYNLKGPSIAIDSACSTALAAIHMACSSILNGDCETAIAGAVNLTLHPIKFETLKSLGMLETDCASHSMGEGKGYMPCEGAGAVLLKPLKKAIEDQDNIYAIIPATGVNHGGVTEGFTVPGGDAEKDLILKTLGKGNLKINDIDYYELSTTGCKIGDQIEIDTVSQLFEEYGNKEKQVPVGSVKSNLGHLEAASGMSQFTKVALQLKYQKLVPTINIKDTYKEQLAKSHLFIQEELESWKLPYQKHVAAINSFGAGGANAFCVLSSYQEKENKEVPKKEYLCIFSSYKVDSLTQMIHQTINYLTRIQEDSNYAKANHFSMERMAYTLQVGREQMPKRLAVICKDEVDLLNKLKEFIQGNYDHVLYKALTEDECLTKGCLKEVSGKSTEDLAHEWMSGVKVQWSALYSKKIRKISLPTLTFIERLYWPEADQVNLVENPKVACSTNDIRTEAERVTSKEKLGAIKKKIKLCIADTLGCLEDEISEKTRFADLGLDSLLLTQLAEKLSKSFKIDVSVTIFYDYFNVQKLANYFLNETPQQYVMEKTPEAHTQKEASIAVVGMSGRFPKADNIDEFWDNLKNGRDCISDIPKERWNYKDYYNIDDPMSSKSYCKMGGFINGVYSFDYEFFNLTKMEASQLDPQQRLLLEEVWHAFEDAGMSEEAVSGSKCGVFVGAGSGDYKSMDTFNENQINAFSLVGESTSMTAGRIAYSMNLKGPAITIDTACSSSLTALHLACNSIKNGECDMALVAGVSLIHTPMIYLMGSQGEMLSPEGKCKAFAQDADGFVPAEGIGVILIKPLSKAQKDKDRIYCVVDGTAINEDGLTNGITAPSCESQAELEASLYRKIEINPEEIGYVEAHGTGTKLGDPIEVEALTKAYRQFTDKKNYCAIGSVKSNVGHGLFSAGITGVIKTILCLYHKKLVPTLHVQEENEFIHFKESPFYINKELKEWHTTGKRIATISSFGFSGTNAHVVLEDYKEDKRSSQAEKSYIFTCSAKTQKALVCQLERFMSSIQDNHEQCLEDISYTTTVGRTHFAYRTAFIADSKEELIGQIRKYMSQEEINSLKPITESEEETFKYSNTSNRANQLQALKEAYLKGMAVEWKTLYKNEDVAIVSMPGYAFECVELNHKSVKKEEVKNLVDTIETEQQEIKESKTYDEEQIRMAVEEFIKETLVDVIGPKVAELQTEETFSQEEFSSLVMREIVNKLGEPFGKLPISLLYEYTTIGQLTDYFMKEHKDCVYSLVGSKATNSSHEEAEPSEDQVNHDSILLKKVWKQENYLKGQKQAENILTIGCSETLQKCISLLSASCVHSRIDLLDEKATNEYLTKVASCKPVTDQILIQLGNAQDGHEEVHKVFNLAKAIAQNSELKYVTLICFYSANSKNVTWLRGLSGFLKTFLAEKESIKVSLVEYVDETPDKLADNLLQEDGNSVEVRYQNNERYVAYTMEVEKEKNILSNIRKDGVYLITGGLGGIGQKLVQYLAHKMYGTIILTGRSSVDQAQLDAIRDQLAHKVTLEYYKADMADKEQVQALMEHINEKYGRLNGIYHLAGTKDDKLLIHTSWEMFQNVLKAKVDGTMLLDEYATSFNLDFYIVFSSVAGAFGNLGQGAYAYANCFAEQYAKEARNKITSVQWPLWKAGGMHLSEKQKTYFYELNGTCEMPLEIGFELIDQILDLEETSITVLYGESEKIREKIKNPNLLVEKQLEGTLLEDMEENMDIAIIGIDGVYPKAKNLEELWNNLVNKKDCITQIPKERWDNSRFYSLDRKNESKYYCQYGGFIDDADKFDPLFFGMAPKDAVYINPQERIMLEVVWHVLEDAGYTQTHLQKEKVGVYMGVTNSDYKLNGFNHGIDDIKAISDPHASVANMVSYVLNLDGPSMAIDTMCSSSLAALYVACQAILTKECESAIVGGANLCMHPQKYMTLCKEGMLSPEGRCKSFGKDGDGYVPGEGVGAILIKPLRKAIKDQDHVYAVIKSCCINHGGHTSGYTVPSPNAQAGVIEDAIKKAGVDPRSISYIETHGTGTSLGDPIEVTGLCKVFEKYTNEHQFCSIGSIKSNIGHLEAASGVASLTKVILQMQNKKLVPSLYSSETNPDIDFENSPFYVQQITEDWNPTMTLENGEKVSIPRRSAVSGFGAGGTNINVILEEYEVPAKVSKTTDSAQVIVLSAKSNESLKQLAKQLADYVSITQDQLCEIAYSLQTSRESMKKRVAFAASSKQECIEILMNYYNGIDEKRIYTGNITLHHKNSFKVDDNQIIQAIKEKDNIEIAKLWAQGAEINWESLYLEDVPSRVKLPLYPFKQEHYGLDEYSICQTEQPELMKQDIEELLRKYQDGEVDYEVIKAIIGE